MQIVKEMIVKSIAGHDKERYYLVVEEKDGYVWIADGKRRRLEKPKKKNVRHLAATNRYCALDRCTTNKQLRLVLHSWNEAKQSDGSN